MTRTGWREPFLDVLRYEHAHFLAEALHHVEGDSIARVECAEVVGRIVHRVCAGAPRWTVPSLDRRRELGDLHAEQAAQSLEVIHGGIEGHLDRVAGVDEVPRRPGQFGG